jgi:hypothetical protein
MRIAIIQPWDRRVEFCCVLIWKKVRTSGFAARAAMRRGIYAFKPEANAKPLEVPRAENSSIFVLFFHNEVIHCLMINCSIYFEVDVIRWDLQAMLR